MSVGVQVGDTNVTEEPVEGSASAAKHQPVLGQEQPSPETHTQSNYY